MKNKMLTAILAAALACIGAGAAAQSVHVKVDSDGNIAFTDRFFTNSPPQTEAAPEVEAPKAPVRSLGIGGRRAAIVNANEAERRLAQAQLKRKQGKEPLAGEWIQRADGRTVNHRYWQRQEKLRLVVEQAQRRLGETRAPLVAAR